MECRTEEKLCNGFPRSSNDRQVAIVVYHLVSTPIDNTVARLCFAGGGGGGGGGREASILMHVP